MMKNANPVSEANRDLLAAMKSNKELFRGSEIDRQNILAVARNSLDSDLGLFKDKTPIEYYLNDTARDRLIVHSRQDSASAMLFAMENWKRLRVIELLLIACLLLNLILGIVLCAVVL